MSYCTILIVPKNKTKNIQQIIKVESDRNIHLLTDVVTMYYNKKNFINIAFLFSSFNQYDILLIEDYHSSFVSDMSVFNRIKQQKINNFRKRGWNETKINKWIDLQENKTERSMLLQNNSILVKNIVFQLAKDYFIAFGYYFQGKEWQGFLEAEIVTHPKDKYEENIIYRFENTKNRG